MTDPQQVWYGVRRSRPLVFCLGYKILDDDEARLACGRRDDDLPIGLPRNIAPGKSCSMSSLEGRMQTDDSPGPLHIA